MGKESLNNVTVLRRELIGTKLSDEYKNQDGTPATVLVFSDWHKVTMSYDELCRDLGFIPETYFVEITKAGTIYGTFGKPEEFQALRAAARQKGYKLRARKR